MTVPWRTISTATTLTFLLIIGVRRGVAQNQENTPPNGTQTETSLTPAGGDLRPSTTDHVDAYCSLPEKIDGSVSWSPDSAKYRFKVGHTIVLKCINTTFTLIGPSTLKCIDPGTWNFEGSVTCQYVVCSAPVAPDNGTLRVPVQEILPDTVAHFGCDPGLTLVGEDQLTCMPSGQWTNNPPICTVPCPPRAVQNGTLRTACGYEGCTASATCPEGTILTGNNSIVCTSTGEWQSTDWPKCIVVCPPPSQIPGGTFITDPLPAGHHYVHQTLATYSCLEGHSLEGDTVLVCTEHGTWNTSAPQCNEIENDTKDVSTQSPDGSTVNTPCPSLDIVPNGEYSIHNNTANYTCNPGYRLQGNQIRICHSPGKWSGESPTCILHKMAPHSWWKVIRSYREWQGKYIFNDQEVGFKFWFLSTKDDKMHALLVDDLHAKLDLEGSSKEGVIIFRTHRLLKPSSLMRDLSWQVRGELSNSTKVWKYTGTVHANEKGFSSLFMEPVAPNKYEKPPLPAEAEYTSATALALGIAIAVMAMIVAAILAAYCVKQKGFKGSGHRTLTSFENPVYEYENNAGVSIK